MASGGWLRARQAAAPPSTALAARRDRAALRRVIRGMAASADLESSAGLIAAQAAWVLKADGACVVRREEDGRTRVVAASGAAPAPGGAVAEALATGRVVDRAAPDGSEAAAPVLLDGRAWGALHAHGPAARLGRGAARRLSPFADLVSLAAATHEARARLASLAGTDPLTGLGNRRTFDGLLEVEAERAARHGDPLGLVMLDLDRFKGVNDRFGHQAGDRVLIEVARRLMEIARRGEAISRIGGEEFAWILPRTDAAGTAAAAARAVRAVADTPFAGVGRLTISAGVCELADAGDPGELVRLADRMLYRAKAEGRNTVRRHSPGPLARI